MQISEKVLTVLKHERISPTELQYMLQHAAITSIRNCNRRYFQWVFQVTGESLQDMQYADVVETNKSGSYMLEEHDPCEGKGCRACGWVGQIARGIEDATAILLTKHPA